jgi:hypothetical protein
MNMRIARLLALAWLTLLLPTALMAADMAQMPAADGQALLDHITKTDPYAKWDLMPGTTRMRQGREPHGALQNVYVNKAALKAITDKAGAMPDGAIIVKENYMPDQKLGSVTVLYKKKGFNPEAGDYMWLKYGADKKILAQGKPAPCIGCHAQAKANDYVILAPLK